MRMRFDSRQSIGVVGWKIYLGMAFENTRKYSWLKLCLARDWVFGVGLAGLGWVGGI